MGQLSGGANHFPDGDTNSVMGKDTYGWAFVCLRKIYIIFFILVENVRGRMLPELWEGPRGGGGYLHVYMSNYLVVQSFHTETPCVTCHIPVASPHLPSPTLPSPPNHTPLFTFSGGIKKGSFV